MKSYFRGSPKFVTIFWFWDLFWIGWSLALAVVTHSYIQAGMGVAFAVLWVIQDRSVKGYNRRYDELIRSRMEYEEARRKVLARLNGDDR